MRNEKEKLALFGGIPVRSRSFDSKVVFDNLEKKAVLDVLSKRSLSRFVGSSSADIEKQLVMTSAKAVSYNPQPFLFLGGEKVRRFEADFSRYFGVKYAVSVNSATSGLITALGSCGISAGDEVITTCLSFNATATSILIFNAIPVFVDIAPDTFCISPKEIEKKISKKTKAILVVHLLGNASDMGSIMKIAKKNRLKVIEDCAQAIGAKYKGRYLGTIGDIGVFSFQESKNIGTGEGGMIVTNNSGYAKKCRLIRNHGESIPDTDTSIEDLVNNIGFNFRMTELTAAVGIEQLKKLSENNRIRNENASYLYKELSSVPGIKITNSVIKRGNVCHVFPVIIDTEQYGITRKIILKAICLEGIPVTKGYPRLMPENPIFSKKIAYGNKGCPFSCPLYGKQIRYDKKNYPVAVDLLYKKFIWFYYINRPNTIEDMKDVVKTFKKVFRNIEQLKNYLE